MTINFDKLAFKDFMIAMAIFVTITCVALPLTSAGTTIYYVVGTNNQGTLYDSGVSGYQQTVSVTYSSGSAVYSFVTLVESTGDFFAVGFMQGTDANGHLHTNPTYYVDRVLNGVYKIWLSSNANVGENHNYMVYTDATGQIMYASIDGTTPLSESGYLSGGKQASGQTETHNSADVMNHHHWGMQYQDDNRWFDFANLGTYVNSPYQINVVSSTEWYATG
jgi:hypothetical protein